MNHAEFEVEGNGVFPVDMLRYDTCWPASERDSYLLLGEHHRRVKLVYRDEGPGPTPKRWESFGWRVVSGPYSR
jgi:hypothetical protein